MLHHSHTIHTMIELSRNVRFSIPLAADAKSGRESPNTFAGWPSMAGIGVWYAMTITCRGCADAATGYLLNIKEIDQAFREFGLPVVADAVRNSPDQQPAKVLARVVDAMQMPLCDILHRVTWHLTPYYSVSMSTATTDQFLLTQTFEFAAAHRLNCGHLSEEENREMFGKCNNPSGHGHNYRVEVSVEVPLAQSASEGFGLVDLEKIVDAKVVDRFDHQNLDLDVPEFADCNSSVENIAKVCYDLLKDDLANRSVELRQIRVWETEKTSCVYPAS